MKSVLFIATLAAASAVAHAQTVFTTNFESGQPAQITGGGSVVGTQGYSAFGFGNSFLYNDTAGNPAVATTLTLTNLPAHTSINIGFLLAIIDSWDSTNGSPSPDYFNVDVDGVNIFQATFANTSGSIQYAPPPGGLLIDQGNLGFNVYADDAFDMSFEPTLQSIAHTASTLTIAFYASGSGWQAGSDESWGIDNLTVTLVPTPSSAAVLGVGALALTRRRR